MSRLSPLQVWDYQTKQCVQTMEGHTHNVAAVCCHPELPIIMSGSEDGTVRIWHANTYRQEYNFNYAYERCWSIASLKGSNNVALAYDEVRAPSAPMKGSRSLLPCRPAAAVSTRRLVHRLRRARLWFSWGTRSPSRRWTRRVNSCWPSTTRSRASTSKRRPRRRRPSAAHSCCAHLGCFRHHAACRTSASSQPPVPPPPTPQADPGAEPAIDGERLRLPSKELDVCEIYPQVRDPPSFLTLLALHRCSAERSAG